MHVLLPLYISEIDSRLAHSNSGIKEGDPLFSKSYYTFFDRTECANWQVVNRFVITAPASFKNFLKKNGFQSEIGEVDPKNQRDFESAVQNIATLSTSSKAAFDLGISGFIYLKGQQFRGASHPHLLGMIIIGEGFFNLSKFDMSLSIVHEMAHQELFLINTVDRLVQSNFEESLLEAPFQRALRPPLARLHSLFALFRMVQLERETGLVVSKNADLLNRNLESFLPAELTPFGLGMVDSIRKWTRVV